MNLSDAALREAASAVCDAMLSTLPAPESCGHRFSPAFLQKMQVLIGGARRAEKRRAFFRQVAAVFLAAVVGVSTWLAVDTEARAAVIRWVREVYEDYVEYRFFRSDDDTSDEVDLSAYAPTWLPDGYREVDRFVNQDQMFIHYEDAAGDAFYFSAMRTDIGAVDQIYDVDEGAEVTVAGNYGMFYRANKEDDTDELIWVDEEERIVFGVSSYLPQDVILHIAESIYLTD